MSTKHTPGPWRYWTQRRPEAEDTCTFRNLAGEEILRAVTVTLTEEDARLIAAAPELLEALQELVEVSTVALSIGMFGLSIPDGADGPLPKAIAAIAKATGETEC